MELVFATNNLHKLSEVQQIIGDKFKLVSLLQIGFEGEIPENQDTLEGNALEKARYILEKTGRHCFADDTGLEVEALNGEPGVFSARYAGPENNAENNISKLLKNLNGKQNRTAQFRTVVALFLNGKEYLFEGVVKGKITTNKIGGKGFGYDPVFIPDGYSQTFAEMSTEQKNTISHRSIAINKLALFLKTL